PANLLHPHGRYGGLFRGFGYQGWGAEKPHHLHPYVHLTDGLMAHCPLCRSRRFRELACVGDEEYATPGGPYLYRECLACLAVYLVDPPWRELSRIYPPNYYSVAPGKSLGLLQILKLQ